MFIDLHGRGVRAEGKLDASKDVVARLRDLIMVNLDESGLSLSQIAAVLNQPKSTVHYRLKALRRR